MFAHCANSVASKSTVHIRGLLAEYGIVIPKEIGHIGKRVPKILEDGENGLPGIFRQLIDRLGSNL